MDLKHNEKGFTLVEMLVVLFIMAVLILVTIPNVSKHFQTIDDKGCEAYTKMVEGQVHTYKLNHSKYPNSLADLSTAGYLPVDGNKCPDGRLISLLANGEIKVEARAESSSSNGN